MDRRTSRASSTDSVPTSTKYALTDALENMRMISQQLQTVDQLFSQKWKEDQQQMQQQQLTVASHVDSSGYSKQGDSRQFTFIPIGRTEPSDPKAPRTHPAQPTRSCILQSGGKAWPTAFALPGQVPSPMQSMRPPVDEEDEYY
ncbi:hypothetical protein FBUS_10128 [Fasciolopsis buskii]|uniref:Uncharacterized protein n=1 Tax=Fasciolopsis buskii TaxID=27845 RepID=A0A8E0VL85_9TREM|nr:hypothetical protein FBUS_10128 [Fasciolopsis buski]